jgi:hypothetical protein
MILGAQRWKKITSESKRTKNVFDTAALANYHVGLTTDWDSDARQDRYDLRELLAKARYN